ncbi:DUF2155 domain-containing protein [Rhodobacterales bacterium HKCCE3408]|nr:DUF2155 domain-containing protein [Rhodobacterales bacterium HKCCE3408]
MGLEGTGVPDQNGGFVTTPDAASGQDGVFVQINPGGQDGVALIQAPNGGEATSVNRVAAEVAPGAMLRGLDKTIGSRTDFEMEQGETVVFGRLAIRMLECRYPADNPASDAFAHLQIADLDGQEIFDGWMVASSPALMALEHPRYDVWVLSCSTS